MGSRAQFDLWLEFENVADVIDDYCNVSLTLDDGRRFALNVWTFSFFEQALTDGESLASAGQRTKYLLPPDLFVAELTRPTIDAVIADLLDRDLMPTHCEIIEAE